MIKNFLLTLLFLFTLSIGINAQSVSYEDLQKTETKQYKKITEYTTKDGTTYKVGDVVKTGMPSSNKTFAFFYTGNGLVIPIEPALITQSNKEFEIKKIRITRDHVFKKDSRRNVIFVLKVPLLGGFVDIENAIEAGEVRTGTISSDDALESLKKAKDKLDLGLITEEEFESTKEELSKYIK